MTDIDEAIGLYRDEIDRLHAEIDRLKAPLDVAVTGLRKLETYWAEARSRNEAYAPVVSDISNLLDKIGRTR